MTEHPGIDKISFTGSVATGKKVMASAAATLKRVTLELGGNDAAIVLDDVDPKADRAEDVLRVVREQRPGVHGDQAHLRAREDLRRALRSARRRGARRRRSATASIPTRSSGRSRTRCSTTSVVGIIEDTKRSGAKFWRAATCRSGPGYFLPPTVVTDIDEDSRLVREEQFGPIVPVLKFTDVDDAHPARQRHALRR